MASWAVVSGVLGCMVAVQYHDVVLGGNAILSAWPDVGSVVSRLQAVQAYDARLRARIASLESAVLAMQGAAERRGGIAAKLAEDLRVARLLSGTTAVEGPGVTVTIDDSAMSGPERAAFLTHEWDLRSVVNEMFLAGAEAVSVGSARVTAQTGIFCIGPLVRVGDTRLGPPFIIRAIGDPAVLQAALSLPGGVLDILRGANRGLRVTGPTAAKRLRIPAAYPLSGGNGS
jgi:uncharacterized protein YlxW (UPF0749 family)